MIGLARAGAGRVYLDGELDHRHGYHSYRDFMLKVFRGTANALRTDGIAAFVVGDVATQNGSFLALASRVWDDVGARSGLTLVDVIEDRPFRCRGR